MMQISLITTTPLRKVTEYVMSTLGILRKSQNKNIVPTMAQHHAYNIRSPNWKTTTLTHGKSNTRGIKIRMYISLPHHRLKIYIHGMVMDVKEPSIQNYIAIGCMGRKPDH